MAFLDDLSRKLTQVGQEAASQTKVFAETTRINAKISDEERQLNAFFLQLGRNYFEANKDNPNAAHINEINNIKDSLHRIDVYRADIRRAKGMVACPHCGSEVSSGVAFCSYCGVQMPKTDFLPDDSVIGFSGGVEGLGTTLNKDGIYSTPSEDGTSLNYNTNASTYDITSLNMDNGSQSNNTQRTTVSLEKKDEF